MFRKPSTNLRLSRHQIFYRFVLNSETFIQFSTVSNASTIAMLDRIAANACQSCQSVYRTIQPLN